MLKKVVCSVEIALAGVMCLQAAQQERALLDRYCVACHNEKLKTAGLALDKMDAGHAPAEAETWEKVIRKLRTGEMPPAGRPRS